MRILFAAGGTGGHLRPALNLAGTLRERDPSGEVFFLTSGRSVENWFVDESAGSVKPLFPGASSRPGLANPLPWLRALATAWRVVGIFKPHAVVATGGYAALPVIPRAFSSRIPLYLLEPNAVPGRATRTMARAAHRIFCHFDTTARSLGRRAAAPGSPVWYAPDRGEGAGAAGQTTSSEGIDAAEARAFFGLKPDRRTLLVAGGSLGAKKLNETVARSLDRLQGDHQVLFITGERDFETVRAACDAAEVETRVLPFCREMDKAYRAADLLLCRAGGMTVAEVMVAGLPAILVPYPHHKDRHQFRNAEQLEAEGAAVILDEKDLVPDTFRQEVVDLLDDPARLLAMRESACRMAKPDAAGRILDTIEADLSMKGSGNVA